MFEESNDGVAFESSDAHFRRLMEEGNEDLDEDLEDLHEDLEGVINTFSEKLDAVC